MDLRGQTFTLEGVAASLLLLIATYTIFQSTVVMSPSWSEFENVQLKQLGYDTLRILDNPKGGNTSLRGMVENSTFIGYNILIPPQEFSSNLSMILEKIRTMGKLEVLCVNTSGNTIEVLNIEGFNKTPTPNAVRNSRFVVIERVGTDPNSPCPNAKVVEVRLTLWR
ncbi:MAG: hypothetical protein NZ872_01960 [Archaeoglobaceae archaeon]|nr:hypothetical protein [Archaeoglobaceae archaeon]MDW8127963.1 hypothetical protein [Archaeoglobaceae archaeon]